jgi:hypothetical protein
MVTEVAMEWAPRITIPASVSLTTPGVQERLGVLVRRRRPVDLRRHDGVGDVEILVARLLVEAHDIVPELPAAPVEELAPAGEPGQHRGDMVGRAAHEPVGAFRPEPVNRTPAAEILGRARDEPHRADAAAAGGIDGGGRVGRAAGGIVSLGDAPDRLREGRVRGDIGDALPVEEDRAAIPEAGQVLARRAHDETLAHTMGRGQGAEAASVDRCGSIPGKRANPWSGRPRASSTRSC